jgi:hypothetical protein
MKQSLFEYPVHLAAGDGSEGRFVSLYRFDADWDSWEMHPAGDGLVACVDGAIAPHQELVDGNKATILLVAGEFAINPPGTRHTADVADAATCLCSLPPALALSTGRGLLVDEPLFASATIGDKSVVCRHNRATVTPYRQIQKPRSSIRPLPFPGQCGFEIFQKGSSHEAT